MGYQHGLICLAAIAVIRVSTSPVNNIVTGSAATTTTMDPITIMCSTTTICSTTTMGLATTTSSTTIESTQDNKGCIGDEFLCNNGQCIPRTKVCDQVANCPDQEEEENCPGPRECGPYTFRCDNGVCVINYVRCDGYFDCKNGEDEICGPECYESGWYDTIHRGYELYHHFYTLYCLTDEVCSTSLTKNNNGGLLYNIDCKGKNTCLSLEVSNPEACDTDPSNIADGEICTYCCKEMFCNKYELEFLSYSSYY